MEWSQVVKNTVPRGRLISAFLFCLSRYDMCKMPLIGDFFKSAILKNTELFQKVSYCWPFKNPSLTGPQAIYST